MDTNADDLEFQKVHETFRPKIHRYLTRLVGEHEAEDLTQEVFIKVNRTLRTFRGESQLSTWIYRIATNTALDRLRRRSPRQINPETSLDNSIGESEGHEGQKNVWTGEQPLSIEQQMVRKEMNECIQDFIKNLPEHYRTVLVLGELEGLASQEISEILGLTLGTVKIRMHRARQKLRETLEAQCDSYWVEGNEFLPDLKRALQEFREIG